MTMATLSTCSSSECQTYPDPLCTPYRLVPPPPTLGLLLALPAGCCTLLCFAVTDQYWRQGGAVMCCADVCCPDTAPWLAKIDMQAVRCVEVMSLLMKQHLRGLVEEGLRAYLQLWQEYKVEPGSLVAYAGRVVCGLAWQQFAQNRRYHY